MTRQVMLLALAAALSGCATDSGPAPGERSGDPTVDRGQQMALRACAACHAVQSGARSPSPGAPSFVIVRLRHNEISLERTLAGISREGHWDMPPLHMSDQQIGDLVAYIETLGPGGSALSDTPPPATK